MGAESSSDATLVQRLLVLVKTLQCMSPQQQAFESWMASNLPLFDVFIDSDLVAWFIGFVPPCQELLTSDYSSFN